MCIDEREKNYNIQTDYFFLILLTVVKLFHFKRHFQIYYNVIDTPTLNVIDLNNGSSSCYKVT